MIRIAICDDDKKELEDIQKKVQGIMGDFKYCGEVIYNDITVFNSGEDLLKELGNGNTFHIYILDVVMPEINGIRLGEHIRSVQSECGIIYTTSVKDYAYEAYAVQAQRYLLKPVDIEELREAVEYSCRMMNWSSEMAISVRTMNGLRDVLLSDIEYIECSARIVKVHLLNDTVVESLFIRRSFEQEVAGVFEDERFIQIHKSYIVNMSQIQLFSHTEITLKSGVELPISKAKQKDVKHNYMQYMANRYH